MRVGGLSVMALAMSCGPALAQTGTSSMPVLPPPLYAAPLPPPQPNQQSPQQQPNGLPGPAVVPGFGGLYNVLTYGQNGPRCTPSLLLPTTCR